jgi:hypothetical protein
MVGVSRKYYSKTPKAFNKPVVFELDDVKYICRDLTILELSEIAKMSGEPVDSPKSAAFIAEFFELVLGRAQYRTFLDATGKAQTQPEEFMEIIQGVFEEMTTKNTSPLSAFSDGQRTTGSASTDDASSRVMRRYENAGRPDLMAAIRTTQENR